MAAPGTKVINPVCGIEVEPQTAKHHADYAGRTYYFCSAGCRERFAALALGLNSFGSSFFPVALRMNAELVAICIRKVEIMVLCSLLDVREGQSTIGIGDVDDLIEPGNGVTHIRASVSGSFRWFGKAKTCRANRFAP